MSEPIKVFISYSHQDDALRQELVEHLAPLQEYEQLIDLWHDREIPPGDNWDSEINSRLKEADIILFLVSSAFINSRYCRSVEVAQALERHQRKEAKVIPVIIRACGWLSTPLKILQGIPRDNKAVASSGDRYARDAVWNQVAQDIGKVARELKKKIQLEKAAEAKQLALAQFQEQAAKFYANGHFSPAQLSQLDIIARRNNLTTEEKEDTINEVKADYEKSQSLLRDYQEAVAAEIEHQGGLNKIARTNLKPLRELLQISEAEARTIEQEALRQWQIGIQQAEKERQQAEEKAKKLEEERLRQKAEEEARKESEKNTLKTFSFVVVELDENQKEKSRKTAEAQFYAENLAPGIDIEMVSIPGGSFQMGSPEGEGDSKEKPQHLVNVPAFYCGKYPVTQAQWKVVAGFPRVNRDLENAPSAFSGKNHPVEQISWFEAMEFCERLSGHTGKIYRLPSEAEWEYACRAGTKTPYHFGQTISPQFANYGRSKKQTTPVGSYQVANAFGLYDMHGNVREWCLDNWHESYEDVPTDGSAWIKNENDNHILRGGSWYLNPKYCRSAFRYCYDPVFRNHFIGFRLICVPR